MVKEHDFRQEHDIRFHELLCELYYFLFGCWKTDGMFWVQGGQLYWQLPENRGKLQLKYSDINSVAIVVHPSRFERETSAFGGQRSIQLSYGCLSISI